jgi:hypothetical protein
MKKILAVVLAAISKPEVQDKLLQLLRTKVIENFIVSTLKLTGFKAWIVGLLADRILEKADDKMIEPIFREVGFQGDVLQGAVIYKKVLNAKDVDDWLSAIRRV